MDKSSNIFSLSSALITKHDFCSNQIFTSLHFLHLIPGRGRRSGSVVSKSFCRLHLLAPPAVLACPGSKDRAISLWVCLLVAFRGSPCPSLVWGCFLVPYGAHAQTIWACSPLLCFLYSLPPALFWYLHSSFCLSLSPTWFFSAFSFLSSLEYFPLSLRSSSILLHTRWQVSPLWYIAWSLTLLVSFYLLSLAPVLSIFATQPSLLLLLLFLIYPLRWKWPLGIWTDPLDSAPCLPYLWCSP